MDPVNKWLTVVILFMIAVLCVMGYKAGSSRYAFTVTKSTMFEQHAVVYILDTKNGVVKAQLFAEDDLQYNGKIKTQSREAITWSPPGYSRRQY